MQKPLFAAMLALAALAALSAPAAAELVPIEWNAEGRFSKDVPVPPGKFVEACEKLAKGARIAWSFEAAASVDFNIHYHEGKKVRFPARRNQVAKDAGTLMARRGQDYCWMWTNQTAAEVPLRFTLHRQ